MKNYIEKEKKLLKTEKSKELYKLLVDIWDNKHFIYGVLNDAKTEYQQQELINLIREGCNDTDKITQKAWEYSGIGIPNEEFDGNPEDILNLDDDDE